MMKVLLADDDFLVRSYLKGVIDWQEQGCELVGTARDGEEALQIAGEMQPDLIIADISMPVMDGIALIRELNRRNSSSIVVVLSCHDEFAYVKEAMKLGAREYLLKNTLTEESLIEVLTDVKREVAEKSEIHPEISPEEIMEEKDEEKEYSQAVAESLRLINMHFREELSLGQLAEAVHLNPAYLSHLFHVETGRTFSDELLSRRIAEAKKLLISTDEKVKEIAPLCGFQDYRNFCKYFKKVVGTSPQSYRKNEKYKNVIQHKNQT